MWNMECSLPHFDGIQHLEYSTWNKNPANKDPAVFDGEETMLNGMNFIHDSAKITQY